VRRLQRSVTLAWVGSLVASLVAHPATALGDGCSVKAAATALGDDVWIHGVATCSAGVRGIRFFIGDNQVGETADADGFATWHAGGATGTYTVRVAATDTSDAAWTHPVQTSLSLTLGEPSTSPSVAPRSQLARESLDIGCIDERECRLVEQQQLVGNPAMVKAIDKLRCRAEDDLRCLIPQQS
jgi:hypothetical protein